MPIVANETARLLVAGVTPKTRHSSDNRGWNRYSCANTESPEKILKRVKTSLSECEQIAYYDLILQNYDLHTSVKLLENDIFNGMLPQLDFDVDEYKVRMKKIIWLTTL